MVSATSACPACNSWAIQRRAAPPCSAVEEAALHNLAIGMARPTKASAMADLRACRELESELPDDWREGTVRAQQSLALAYDFLAGTSEQARAKTLEALKEGAAAATIWDAVRLSACDLFARRPSLLPVHPTTVEQTARVALLQAVSTIPVMRDALSKRGATPLDGAILDQLLEEPQGSFTLAEALDKPEPAHIRAHLKGAGNAAELRASMCSLLYRGCVQNHQVKFLAALLEDAERCAPCWRSVLLAPAFGYLPTVKDDGTEVYGRSLAVRASLR